MVTVVRLCWGLLPVLGCWSALAAPPPSSGGHGDAAAAAAGCSRTALVPCPKASGEIRRLHLFRDHQVTCNYSCKLEQDVETCEPRSGCSDVTPGRSEEGRFSGFMVTPSKTPVTYRCEVTVKFPPPLTITPGDPSVVVLVEELQCGGQQSRSADDLDDTRSRRTWLLIWIAVAAVLGLYSLAATILAGVFWGKLRRMELHNDYVNSRPQRAKKRKGIQNPFPPRF